MKHTIDWARSGALGLVFLVIGFGCGRGPSQDPKVISTVRVEIAQPPPGPNQTANEAEPDTPAAAESKAFEEALIAGTDLPGIEPIPEDDEEPMATVADLVDAAPAPPVENEAPDPPLDLAKLPKQWCFGKVHLQYFTRFCSKTQWACEARRQTKSDHPGDVAPCHFTDAPPIMCRGKECFSVSNPDG